MEQERQTPVVCGSGRRRILSLQRALVSLWLFQCLSATVSFTVVPNHRSGPSLPSSLRAEDARSWHTKRLELVGKKQQWQPSSRFHDDKDSSTTTLVRQHLLGLPDSARRRFSIFSSRGGVEEGNDIEEDDDDEDSPRMRDRIRGWFRSSSKDGGEDPPRVKSNFDGLFSGMPGMDDIIGEDETGGPSMDDDVGSPKGRSVSPSDDSWFDQERSAIMQNYEKILEDMLQNLEDQRQENPENVPDNAEAMIKSVLKQEMDTELEETKQRMALERLDLYEEEQLAQVEQQDVSGPVTDSRVQRLIDESEAEYERQMEAQNQMDEFLRYEEEAFRAAAASVSEEITKPEPNANLDQWALERLEEMATKQEGMETDEVVLDILDENLEDLKERMEKESSKGTLQPETMKEWQMYRAIANRLGVSVDAGGSITNSNSDATKDISDEDVFNRLQSWKEYNEKEVDIREQGGLSRGPKLPFEWQELSDTTTKKPTKSNRESRIETRKQINRMSIEALESLLLTSDAARRIKLQDEIDYLKRELESNDYLDWIEPEEDEEEEVVGPVDLSGVFTSSSADTTPKSAKIQTAPPTESTATNLRQENVPPPPAPPITPFFEETEKAPPPPATAFFSDEDDEAKMEVAQTDSKLGTMDDQKLESMFRKSGVRNKEEQERIRAEFEEFKRIEEEQRKLSGLDQGGEGSLAEMAAKYNVSESMMKDGDVDAERVLSMIGPRPTRTKKVAETSGGEKPAPENADPTLVSAVDEKDVASSLYRSVSAAGGGRYKDDPVAKAKNEASYMEFLEMERQMRENVDNIPEESLESSIPSDVDEKEYAEQAIAELGPRPITKKIDRVDEQFLSDNGGVVPGDYEEEDDDDDDVGDENPAVSDEIANGEEDVPEWVKSEKKARDSPPRRSFLRDNDIEEAFSDDEYEKNMRQLAEYERRRAGKEPRQIGIDISDVLGPRRDIETDDYKDYKFDDDIYRGRRVGWGGGSFEARKRDLLEYVELDVPLLNALMEQRDSVSASGVSRYMAKINKPFKEFGAIFRLEGVIVGMDGLHAKAWYKTASTFDARQPSQDEVKMAAVVRPEAAISDIFAWTTDLGEIKQLATSYRDAFNEVFEEWAHAEGLDGENTPSNDPSIPERGSLAIGEEFAAVPVQQQISSSISENELLGLLINVWGLTADQYKFPRPSQDQIVAAASMEAVLAVTEVFGWLNDPLLADDVASYFRRTMEAVRSGKDISATEGLTRNETPTAEVPKQKVLDQNMLMELHYQAWSAVATTYGFEQPSTDEVLSAFVLNDPALVVKGGYGWTSDIDVAQGIAESFTEELRALLDNPNEILYGQATPQNQGSKQEEVDLLEEESSSTPLFEDIVAMHSEAWISTSKIHGFDTPTLDQVRLSVSIDPEEFVQRVIGLDRSLVEPILATFKSELRESSKVLMQKMGYSNVPQSNILEEQTVTTVSSGPRDDDVFEATMSSWNAIAAKFRLPEPTTDQILYAMSVGPEEAIRYGFRWTDDEDNVSELLNSYLQEVEEKRTIWASTEKAEEGNEKEPDAPLVQVTPGSAEWIKSLLDVEMECGIISYLTRSQVDTLVEYAGIADLITPEKRVAATGPTGLHPTVKHFHDSQQMLASALRLERRPDHCVVVDASPGASIAARSVEMQSVAWIGSYPRYELLQADATVSRLDELTAMNIRRLFGERIYDQPLMDQLQAQPETKRRTKTIFEWDE
mmetsp:Transcript_39253/g.81457  ORF Transcript_39253/g.81457 Transcript_39253/m.81457 type:complete len:1720 (-) Transcript_39253:106-5265(-)